jgi:hypothetical protein
LELAEFEQFVLPHLSVGSRGPAPKLGLYKIFNYVLKILYLGCQWKELPIHKDGEGHPETHYTRIYRIWRRWVDNSFMDAIFAGSVSRLHEDGRLDTAVIHGDGTTTAAITSASAGTKKVKGDKIVAFSDRRCNVAAQARPQANLRVLSGLVPASIADSMKDEIFQAASNKFKTVAVRRRKWNLQ